MGKQLTIIDKINQLLFKGLDELINFLAKIIGILASMINIETFMLIAFVFSTLSILNLISNIFQILYIFNSGIASSTFSITRGFIRLLYPIIGYIAITKSEYVRSNKLKDKYLQIFITIFSLNLAINLAHILNNILWTLFFYVPNSSTIITEDPYALKTAFSVPLVLIAILWYSKIKTRLYTNLK